LARRRSAVESGIAVDRSPLPEITPQIGHLADAARELRSHHGGMSIRSAEKPSFDPLHEQARGAVTYPALASLPGIDQLRAFLTGAAPAPAVARLTGRRIVEASVGSATYALGASNWMVGPKGGVHPGVLAVLADGALIGSVVSALPSRVLCTTAELSMTFLGSPAPAGGELTAHGRLLHLDTEMGLAEVHVNDSHGRLVAHGTSRCAVFPPVDGLLARSEPATCEPATPDPHLRPVAPPGSRVGRNGGGLDVLRAQLDGNLPRPPIDQLTGIRLAAAEEGGVLFTLPASPWLRNEWGTVYGGFLTLLGSSAAAAAIQTTAPEGTGFAARDIKVNFLRAVPADGRELRAVGSVLHRGKRLAIGTAEIRHGGDLVAIVTGTTALDWSN
jgi:uncharacterized protein (TIGR00369 family)